MKLSANEFEALENKSLTLMGMSGLGKTTLSDILQKSGWYHYSADYRIGTRYMDAPILDNLKDQMRDLPMIGDLLAAETIKIQNNITIENLSPLSTFIGKIGNPEKSGLPLAEFRRRQMLYYNSEISAMQDVPEFMDRAGTNGHHHFVNDSTGSLCEIEDESVFELLAKHTILIYIEATKQDEEELIRRAQAYPKPLFMPDSFFHQALKNYMGLKDIDYVALIDPDDFGSWVFPELFRARLPKYKRIAQTYGYTVSADDVRNVRTTEDLMACISSAIAQQQQEAS